jgi:elongation factor P hydroxylase
MRRALWFGLIAVVLVGCDNPQKTIDKLRSEISSYKEVPTDRVQAQIEVDFTKLEAQIQKLQTKGKTSEALTYRASADNLRGDYRAARMLATMKDAQNAIEGLGHAFKDAGSSISEAFRKPSTASPTPNQP